MSSLAWPKITVFTTVKNSAATLEKSMLSIISQRYPKLEYIVIDGGSTDGTIDIIKKYAQYITHWESREDDGPDYNIGLELMSGDIILFLNADDWIEPNTLFKAANVYQHNPNVDIISFFGRVVEIRNNQYYTLLKYTKEEQIALTLNNILNYVSAIGCRYFSKRLLYRIPKFETYTKDNHINRISDKKFLINIALLRNINAITIPTIGHTYLFHEKSAGFNRNAPFREEIVKEHIILCEELRKRPSINLVERICLSITQIQHEARLIFHVIKKKDFSLLKHRFWKYLKRHPLLFLIILITTPLSIFYRRFIYYSRIKNNIIRQARRLKCF